jgi:hypothetical protein
MWRHALAQVSLDILDHNDGVVDDKADGEHNRQQGQQVDGESKQLHQRHGTNERDRNGHDRNQDRAERAEKHENHQHDDEQGLGERVFHFVDGILDIVGAVVSDDRGNLLGDLLSADWPFRLAPARSHPASSRSEAPTRQ